MSKLPAVDTRLDVLHVLEFVCYVYHLRQLDCLSL